MFQPHKITTEPLPDMSQGKLQNSSPVSASLMKRTSCDILIISGAVETVLWRNITSDHLHDIHEEIFKSVPCIVTEDRAAELCIFGSAEMKSESYMQCYSMWSYPLWSNTEQCLKIIYRYVVT